MWPPAVGVGAVLGKDGPQVPFAKDQDAVSGFGSGGKDEAFGEAVRSRTARWDSHGVNARVGQDCVEGGGELACPVADEESEGGSAAIEVLRSCGPLNRQIRSDGPVALTEGWPGRLG